MNDDDDLTAALAMLNAALRRRWARTPAEVRVFTAERPDRAAFVLPFPSAAVAPVGSPATNLSATARRILRTIAAMDEEEPVGTDIAAQAKLPADAHFRKLLGALRQQGYLAGAKGDAGYGLTPMGLASLEA